MFISIYLPFRTVNMVPMAAENVARHISCEIGLLSRADGSATVNQGDTSVMVSVYGPGEVKMSKELTDRATVEVVYKPKSGLPGCAEKFPENIIRNICESVLLISLHPRSCVSITLQELQNSGCLLACCINTACLAMLDSSLGMKYLVAAVTALIDEDDKIFLNPTRKQEECSKSCLTFAFDSVKYNIVTVRAVGNYTNEQYQTCLSACREASRTIFQFYRESIQKKMSKSIQSAKII